MSWKRRLSASTISLLLAPEKVGLVAPAVRRGQPDVHLGFRDRRASRTSSRNSRSSSLRVRLGLRMDRVEDEAEPGDAAPPATPLQQRPQLRPCRGSGGLRPPPPPSAPSTPARRRRSREWSERRSCTECRGESSCRSAEATRPDAPRRPRDCARAGSAPSRRSAPPMRRRVPRDTRPTDATARHPGPQASTAAMNSPARSSPRASASRRAGGSRWRRPASDPLVRSPGHRQPQPFELRQRHHTVLSDRKPSHLRVDPDVDGPKTCPYV